MKMKYRYLIVRKHPFDVPFYNLIFARSSCKRSHCLVRKRRKKKKKKKKNKERGNKLKQLRRVPVILRPVTKSGKLDGQENVLCVQSRLLQLILFGQQRQNKDIVRASGFAEGMFKNVIIAGENFHYQTISRGYTNILVLLWV